MNLNQPKELLKKLLEIELHRLDVAVEIEKKRNIVFPETTIIIRDILKLSEAINGKEPKENKDQGDSRHVEELDEIKEYFK